MPPAKTVLVVDDSRVSRLLACQFILARRCFWHVEEAARGEDALERVRALCPDAHISLVTANVQMATRRRAAELGLGFLAKPMTAQRIGALLDALG
jgi:CheY-like chemotaxis protein